MFRKFAIISFGFFILSGNFNNFIFFNSLPIDISILSMIIPSVYFVFYTLKTMSVHKSFFFISAFFVALLPIIVYFDNDNQKVLMFLLMFFVLSIISPVLLNTKHSAKLFIKSLFVSAIMIVILTLFGLDDVNASGRLTLDGGNPIWLARAVAIAALVLLVALVYNKIGLFKFLICFSPVFIIMVSTGSKGPIFALVLAFSFIYFGKTKKFLTNKKTLISVAVMLFISFPVILIAYFTQSDSSNIALLRVFNIFSGNSGESTSARLTLYQDALDVIANNPLGIGIGNFNQYSFARYPHNIILESYVEMGWIVGSFFIAILILSFVGLKRLSNEGPYGDILFGIFIMSLINSMVSGDLTSPKELYVMLPIGINLLLATSNEQSNNYKRYRFAS